VTTGLCVAFPATALTPPAQTTSLSLRSALAGHFALAAIFFVFCSASGEFGAVTVKYALLGGRRTCPASKVGVQSSAHRRNILEPIIQVNVSRPLKATDMRSSELRYGKAACMW
jgi:hypothetical protein